VLCLGQQLRRFFRRRVGRLREDLRRLGRGGGRAVEEARALVGRERRNGRGGLRGEERLERARVVGQADAAAVAVGEQLRLCLRSGYTAKGGQAPPPESNLVLHVLARQVQVEREPEALLHEQRALVGVGRDGAVGQLDHVHLGVDAQLEDPALQLGLHLDAVVVQLRHGEDAQAALVPHLLSGGGVEKHHQMLPHSPCAA